MTKIFILTRRGSASHILRDAFGDGLKGFVVARVAQIG